MSKLSADQVAVNLNLLPQWKFEEDQLTRKYKKQTFREVIDLVNQIADLAEAQDHHPDMRIQYNKLTIVLSTHDSHGVTGKDFLLAQKIEALI